MMTPSICAVNGPSMREVPTDVSSTTGDVAFVAVPGGRALVGSTPEEVDRCVEQWSTRLVDPSYVEPFRAWITKESPAHHVDVEPFWLARFPVTNGEFRHFSAQTGITAASLETSRENDRENDAAGASSDRSDHPVWGVDRQACVEFAAWCSDRDGHHYRLPSEVEWEWAARGPERFDYPFGMSFDPMRCNTIEGGVGGTTPVDHYPNGVSPFGVWDMAGNVEEHTMDNYGPYPNGQLVVDDLYRELGPGYPILRGGSWALGGDLARCARRHGPYRGGDRFRYVGFRLACTTAPW